MMLVRSIIPIIFIDTGVGSVVFIVAEDGEGDQNIF